MIEVEGNLEDGAFWQEYLDPSVLQQYRKLPKVTLDSPENIKTLQDSWYYQYVVMWLDRVSESHFTTVVAPAEFKPDEQNSYTGKRLWKDVKFDEILFLRDVVNGGGIELDTIRLRLMRQVLNQKDVRLRDWDELIPQYLERLGFTKTLVGSKFGDLSPLDQIKTLYDVIKAIEMKSLHFKQFLAGNTHLFENLDVHFQDSDGSLKHLFLIPSSGALIERKIHDNPNVSLNIPIKLANCTVRLEPEPGKLVELVHLDFGPQIDQYLESCICEHIVIAGDLDSLLIFWEEHVGQNEQLDEMLIDFLPHFVDRRINSTRLATQVEKTKVIEELVTNRKRSSRLVARQEDAKKRKFESDWYNRLDQREDYIRQRSRQTAKFVKRVKDTLLKIIWSMFERDYKLTKLQNRNGAFEETQIDGEDKLDAMDSATMLSGENFNRRLLDLKEPINLESMGSDELSARDLPTQYCLKEEDLNEAEELGLQTPIDVCDRQDWIFQCYCMPDEPPEVVKSDFLPTDSRLTDYPLICCDKCLRWQHWGCQSEEIIKILTLAINNPAAKHNKLMRDKISLDMSDVQPLPEYEFNTVSMAMQLGQRRSTRIKSEEPETVNVSTRPIDRRFEAERAHLFICGWCLQEMETEVRSNFADDLRASRQRERAQRLEIEEKRRLKEERKRQRMEERQRQLHSALPVLSASDSSLTPASSHSTTPYISGTTQQFPAQGIFRTNNTIATPLRENANAQYPAQTPSLPSSKIVKLSNRDDLDQNSYMQS